MGHASLAMIYGLRSLCDDLGIIVGRGFSHDILAVKSVRL
jgi:hypothetical protein